MTPTPAESTSADEAPCEEDLHHGKHTHTPTHPHTHTHRGCKVIKTSLYNAWDSEVLSPLCVAVTIKTTHIDFHYISNCCSAANVLAARHESKHFPGFSSVCVCRGWLRWPFGLGDPGKLSQLTGQGGLERARLCGLRGWPDAHCTSSERPQPPQSKQSPSVEWPGGIWEARLLFSNCCNWNLKAR